MDDANSKYAAASQNYENYRNKTDEAVNAYSGVAGWNLAKQQASELAQQNAANAGNIAGGQATSSALTSGVNKAKAAMLGAQTAANTVGNTYQNSFNSAQNAALSNNQNTIAANQNAQQMAQNELSNARGWKQQQRDNAWNTAGNVAGIAGGVIQTAAAISDERLKEAKKVSTEPKSILRVTTKDVVKRIGEKPKVEKKRITKYTTHSFDNIAKKAASKLMSDEELKEKKPLSTKEKAQKIGSTLSDIGKTISNSNNKTYKY